MPLPPKSSSRLSAAAVTKHCPVLPEVTGVPEERIHVRTRRRSKRGEQYRKLDEQANFHFVIEGGLKFRVNFDDYLDTGLFLDHRMTRARLREAASGKRFLNLFRLHRNGDCLRRCRGRRGD